MHSRQQLSQVLQITNRGCLTGGSRCPLRMHVVDGEIKYVETDNTGDDMFNHSHLVRVCLVGIHQARLSLV
ncbi:hypothetical protein [Photobacterium aquimaris]|uniref:hypothetical protein n=1 Tax=Photobacterium aquimaris TaxID=512643 RepID=UPI00076A99F2|nr:hypothetical protein AYY21_05505 [Photobacterium aquimaris]